MDVMRKSIAVLILIFIGVPTLLGIIWAVGVTKAVVSTDFLTDLPQEIIEKVPHMIDEMLEEIDREDLVRDPNSRAWVRAVANAETSPRELLGKIGVLNWLENELSTSFKTMGEMLKGERPFRNVVLNLRPLKEALRHEAIKEYLIEILKKLPTCDDDQHQDWVDAAANPRDLEDLPACRPANLDLAAAAQAINFVREREIEDIPDEVNMFDDPPRSFPRGVNFLQSIIAFTYLLFLIPAVFIVVAAVIGGTGSRGGVLRWMGVPILIGGLIAYGLSFLVRNAVPWAIGFAPEAHRITAFEEVMIGKTGVIGNLVVDQILAGVNAVAGVVCIIGVVLFAVSYLVRGSESESKTSGPQPSPQAPQNPPPPPPAKEPVIEAEFIKEEKPVTESEPGEDKKLSPGEGKPDIEPVTK
ncbi:MAG: hypothetical protein GY950_34975 [bacterium]|nr:hypothetical protein [bacterium]